MITILRKIQESRSTCALITFITAGDPNLDTTELALKTLDSSGADIIELGLPYSVPLADGPIIQAASKRALAQKMNLDKILNIVDKVNRVITTPIVLFTYYNPILSRGIFAFLQDISQVGIAGLLIPDLPLEESPYIIYLCSQFNIELIFLIAPTSTITRIKNIAQKSASCIYLVSKTGVTGISSINNMSINNLITQIKKITSKPLIVGFGISTLEQIQQLHKLKIEGIVLGSAFVKKLSFEKGIENISEFCRAIKKITSQKT